MQFALRCARPPALSGAAAAAAAVGAPKDASGTESAGRMVGRLSFIDLAGSERGAGEGVAARGSPTG